MPITIRRRDLIAVIGSAAAWPLATRAQQGERIRRIGVLSGLSATTPDAVLDKQTFEKSLEDLGWTLGRNVSIEYRWSALNATEARSWAKELLGKVPDVMLAMGTTAITGLIGETKTVPIVFTRVSDRVGQGSVTNVAEPGGNVTGSGTPSRQWRGSGLASFSKEIAPNIVRVAA